MNNKKIKTASQIIDGLIDQYEAGDCQNSALAAQINELISGLVLYRAYYNDGAGRKPMEQASANWFATERDAQAFCDGQNALHPQQNDKPDLLTDSEWDAMDAEDRGLYYAARHEWSCDVDINIADYREASAHLGDTTVATVCSAAVGGQMGMCKTRELVEGEPHIEDRKPQKKDSDGIHTHLDHILTRLYKHMASKAKKSKGKKPKDKPEDRSGGKPEDKVEV